MPFYVGNMTKFQRQIECMHNGKVGLINIMQGVPILGVSKTKVMRELWIGEMMMRGDLDILSLDISVG
jgi:hypothetical protein